MLWYILADLLTMMSFVVDVIGKRSREQFVKLEIYHWILKEFKLFDLISMSPKVHPSLDLSVFRELEWMKLRMGMFITFSYFLHNQITTM